MKDSPFEPGRRRHAHQDLFQSNQALSRSDAAALSAAACHCTYEATSAPADRHERMCGIEWGPWTQWPLAVPCVQPYLLEPSLQHLKCTRHRNSTLKSILNQLKERNRLTAQHSTAQHSTAQHSTAQHSTAQRLAGQKLTAPDN